MLSTRFIPFAGKFSLGVATISRKISKLDKKGYLKINYKRTGSVVTGRLIEICENDNNTLQNPMTKRSTADDKKVKENSTNFNITSSNTININNIEAQSDFFNLTSDEKRAHIFNIFIAKMNSANFSAFQISLEADSFYEYYTQKKWTTKSAKKTDLQIDGYYRKPIASLTMTIVNWLKNGSKFNENSNLGIQRDGNFIKLAINIPGNKMDTDVTEELLISCINKGMYTNREAANEDNCFYRDKEGNRKPVCRALR